jgi:hypothetical protein
MAMINQIIVIWVLILCHLVSGSQHFTGSEYVRRGAIRLHKQLVRKVMIQIHMGEKEGGDGSQYRPIRMVNWKYPSIYHHRREMRAKKQPFQDHWRQEIGSEKLLPFLFFFS